MPRILAPPAMTPEAFRAALARHGLDAEGFAALLRGAGDGTYLPWIRRRVRRWTSGASGVPGEAALALRLLDEIAALREALDAEPTPEMVSAGVIAQEEWEGAAGRWEMARLVYAAMRAAAPPGTGPD